MAQITQATHYTHSRFNSLIMAGLTIDTCRVDIKTLKVFPKGFALTLERISITNPLLGTVITLSPEETAELLVLLRREEKIHNSSEEF